MIISRRWDIIYLSFWFVGSYGSFLLYVYFTDSYYTMFKQHFTFDRLFYSPYFYLSAIITASFCTIFDFFIECARVEFYPNPRDFIMSALKNKEKLADLEFLAAFNEMCDR
jgi:hypothetical protein